MLRRKPSDARSTRMGTGQTFGMSVSRIWWRRALGSVRVRVTLLAAGVFAVTLVVAATLLLRSLEDRLVGDVRQGDAVLLREQAMQFAQAGVPTDAVATEAGHAIVRGQLPNGQLFVVSYSGSDVLPIPPEAISLAQPADASTLVGVSGVDDLGVPAGRSVFTALPVGDAVFTTASPLDEVRDTIATTTRLLWLVGPALVALVAGLAWLLASRALHPVRILTSRVAEIEAHSLHDRVPEPASDDEIAELARTMNQMLERLDAASETSRRLVSDASHELRTPVAVMRTELEVAQRDAANDWTATGGVLLGELDRLQYLVDDLLLLARGDEKALARDDVDLVEVVNEVAARRRRVAVEVRDDPGSVVVAGDRLALVRALDHLADNAARSADDHVAISIESVNGDLAIHVDDDGPGIAEADRAIVVRRFVRLDEGRARDQGGAGLGLAVASDVAAAHGGHLAITDSPIGGARITITLPVPAG